MSAMIQIRNVPSEVHRKLKSRAALAGMSLSDYLLTDIREVAARQSLDEIRARLRSLPPIEPSIDPVDIVRGERDGR